MTGPVRHTIAFGTEFGRQTGLSLRNSGVFPNNANNPFDIVNPFSPTYFGPVVFRHKRLARDRAQRPLGKLEVDVLHVEQFLILAHQRVPRLCCATCETVILEPSSAKTGGGVL